MSELDILVFSWINLGEAGADRLLPLARFASLELPGYVLAGTVCIVLAGRSPWREQALRALAAMALAAVIARFFKDLAHVPRPFMLGIGHAWLPHAGSAGFPSSHSSVAFAFATCAALTPGAHSVARTAFFLLAALVAWSRVALGLHFPSDVCIGAVVGTMSALLVQWLGARDLLSSLHLRR
ncbi:MAG: phosphatase PAP2 family protein [Burkholderiales bacterium]|nr:phosphatase PAP2 family protein [Burkholderiales bacterium]